jgi:hypothetical protein
LADEASRRFVEDSVVLVEDVVEICELMRFVSDPKRVVGRIGEIR